MNLLTEIPNKFTKKLLADIFNEAPPQNPDNDKVQGHRYKVPKQLLSSQGLGQANSIELEKRISIQKLKKWTTEVTKI